MDDATAVALVELLERGGERIAKRWAKESPVPVGGREVTRPLPDLLHELARVLRLRGAAGLGIWRESIRRHGGVRQQEGFSAAELIGEFQVLAAVLAEEWRAAHGAPPEPAVAVAIAEIAFAGAAASADDYVRAARRVAARLHKEASLQSILNHIAEGLITAEVDGTISVVTPQGGRVLGLPPEELVGLGRADAASVIARLELSDEHGRRLTPEELPYLRALDTGQAVRSHWLKLRRPSDGAVRLVQTDAIPIHEEGQVRGVVQTLHDRTEEWESREALGRAYDELRRLHVQLLERSRTRAVGELAAGVAGTLNNAMNVIRLHTQLEVGGRGPSAHLAAIEASIDEVARLIGRLQQLAAPRPMEVAAETMALDDVVREAVELLQPERAAAAAEGRTLHIALELASRAQVTARRRDVHEAVIHLVLRALAARATRLTLRTWVERGEAVLACPSPAGAEGLEVVDDLTRGWGGTVAPRGEDVVVTLPLARPLEAPARGAAAGPEVAGAARSVLVVDDDADQRSMLAAVLRAEGLEVEEAGTAAEADERADHRAFDAALVDLAMPDRSGWEILAALRRKQPGLRAAIVSGYDTAPPARVEAASAPDAVFRKPVRLPELFEFLRARR